MAIPSEGEVHEDRPTLDEAEDCQPANGDGARGCQTEAMEAALEIAAPFEEEEEEGHGDGHV